MLLYGLESISLNAQEIDQLSTFESNTIKTALGLPTRIHSSNLLAALNIDDFAKRLKLLQTSMISRLVSNQMVKEFINNLSMTYHHNVHTRSYLKVIAKYLKPNISISNLDSYCIRLNRSLKSSFKLLCKTSSVITRIRNHLHNDDRDSVIASCIAFF